MIISAYLGVSGLGDVGYQFFNGNETANGSRVTAGVLDASDGWYSADAIFPSGIASVRWNSSGQPTIVAREYFSSIVDNSAIADAIWDEMIAGHLSAGSTGEALSSTTAIKAKTDNLPSAAPGSTGGIFIAGSNADTNVNVTGNRTGDLIGNVTGSVHEVTNPDLIATAVRDVPNDSPASGSLGEDVKTASEGVAGGDPWLTLLPGAYGAGTAGKILGDRLDVLVSSRLADADFVPAPTANENAVATRDIDNSSPPAGSLGDAINSAASAGDPWGTVLPGAYAAGTAGKIIGDRVDVLVSSRLAAASYVAPPTPTVIAEATRDINNQTPAALSLGAAVNAAAAAGDPWQTPLPGSYPSGSAGKLMSDNLDAKVSTRLPTSGYTVPPTANQNATATRDIDNTSPPAGSLGDKINNAASAGDPWGTAIPGAYPAGSAGKIIGDNVDAKISIMLPSASYVVPPTSNDIAEAVRDVDNTSPASNSLGEAVNEGGDPLSNPVPGSYAPGTAGKVLGDNLNTTVSSRSTYAGTDTPGTTTLLTRVPDAITVTGGKVDVNDKTGFSLTPAYDAAKTAAQPGDAMSLTPAERTTLSTAIWSVLTSAMTLAGSIGKWIVDHLDVVVSTRLPTSSYVAPDNASITAIKAKTDTIPANPVSVSDVPTAAQNAAATRDVSNATPVAGSLGADVKAAAVVSDPWAVSVPSSYGIGTAGHVLGTNLDATVSSRLASSAITINGGAVTVGTNNDKTGYSLASGQENLIADAILKRDWQVLSGEPAYCVLNALRLVRNRWEVTSDGTLKVYREDGAAIAWSRSVIGDANAVPITGIS